MFLEKEWIIGFKDVWFNLFYFGYGNSLMGSLDWMETIG